MYIVYENQHDSETLSVYGFMVYRKDGKSMPKGMITSFNAYWYKANVEFESRTQIEFAVQSPTGDASDHYNYSMPCVDFHQAKAIVDTYRNGVEEMVGVFKYQEMYS